MNKYNDPIVGEIRRVRNQLARRYRHDVRALCADIMNRQDVICAGHPVVRAAKCRTKLAMAS